MIIKYILSGVFSLGLILGPAVATAQVIGEDSSVDMSKILAEDMPGGTPRTGFTGESIQSLLFKADGTKVGFAIFRRAPRGVIISVSVGKLSSGWHGMHIHEVADCRASPPFSLFDHAGDHLGASGLPHGFMKPGGPQNGDLPNIWIGTNGTGRAEVYSETLEFEDVVKDKGRSFIIDALPDDHITQPSGGSGEHVACGIVRREVAEKQ